MSESICVQEWELPEVFHAVFSGAESEDPELVAIFVDRRRANEYIDERARDGDGERLVFQGCVEVGRFDGPAGARRIWVANDYRVSTEAEFATALAGPTTSCYDGDPDRPPGALLPTPGTPGDGVPRHLRLALADATRAFATGDLGRLSTVNEDIQGLVDAALAWGRRQRAALTGNPGEFP